MITFLVVLVVVLAAIAIAKLSRVYELTSELRENKEEEIDVKDNKFNGRMMLLFMVFLFSFFAWQIYKFAPSMLPESASEHGVALDELLNFNWWIIIIVFILTHILLFWYCYKYYYRPDRKAAWFPHNNKLEMVWTVVPAVVLAVIIIYGLKVWNEIMVDPEEEDFVVELYSKQFDWTARYTGDDNTLGSADFNLISGTNPLGIFTKEAVAEKVIELDGIIAQLKKDTAEKVLHENTIEEIGDKIARLTRHRNRAERLGKINMTDGADDITVKGEFHLPVGKIVKFVFRSQDVIHSAFMPHFRAQMNTVPGMVTSFTMKPILTTVEMREKLGDENFTYMLMCNKICGATHFNMKMDIIIESEEEFNTWLKAQKTFAAKKVEETDVTPADGEESSRDEDKPIAEAPE